LPASDPEIGFNQILLKQVIYQKISDINILAWTKLGLFEGVKYYKYESVHSYTICDQVCQ
jgi:hypothetical protein